MMYRILHKLFGWDYIHWQNSCDSGIARVRVSPDGTVWFYRYKSTNVVDRIAEYPESLIIFLTCKRNKYIV